MKEKTNLQVCIIGGGASGLVAAISAARLGASVTILEQMDRVGKKILATGNGRCNLTNKNVTIEQFHGKNPKFIYGAFGQFSVEQTLNFFEMLGITHKIEEEKVYPFSDQASSVLDVLRYEVNQLGIKEICGAQVIEIIPMKTKFELHLKEEKILYADKVILATGGKASPQLGSNGSGFALAEKLGHTVITPFPALVQLHLKSPFLKRLKGVKFKGEAGIYKHEQCLRKEKGEILFTDYGISGPPILQLSRLASQALHQGETPWIKLNLFPQISYEEMDLLLQTRWGYEPEKPLDFSLVGLINKRLIPVILSEAGITQLQKPCGQVTNKERKKLLKILTNWALPIVGTQSWSQAQVTAGGVHTKEIDPKTMESKIIPNLYFAGEIMDIDGDCGGFNLQWAWSSGYIAGKWSVSS